MSDKRYPDESPDRFSEYIRDRLNDHRIPVDDSCWEAIESRSKQKRSFSLQWIAGLIAAAVIIMIVFILFPRIEDHSDEELITHTEKATSPTRPVQKQETRPVEDTNAVNILSTGKPVLVKTVSSKEVEEDRIVAEDILTNNEPDLPPIDEPKDQTIEKDQHTGSDIGPKEDKERKSLQRNRNRLQTTTAKNGNKSWLIAALVGTGGASAQFIDGPVYDYNKDYNNQTPSENPKPGTNPDPDPPAYYDNSKRPEDYPDIDHAVPISAGITVRKNLSNRIAIESGLVYTYLSSKLKTGYGLPHEGRLGLHYLGVPLNLVVTIWEQPKWNIYISAGGMAEKGLRSIYKQDRYDKLELISTTEKESINGLAWSINGSIGASYRFTKDWSFYVEPRISYYFDTDQPVSIRTEHATSFGLAGGIRFQF